MPTPHSHEHEPRVALTPRDNPLLNEPVWTLDSGPLARPEEFERLLDRYRASGLTPAEALTWLLSQDVGLRHREVARVRGITQRAVADVLTRARHKLDRAARGRDA